MVIVSVELDINKSSLTSVLVDIKTNLMHRIVLLHLLSFSNNEHICGHSEQNRDMVNELEPSVTRVMTRVSAKY